LKLVVEFENGILVYEYKEDVYIVVNVPEEETKVSRSWYTLARHLEIINTSGKSENENKALEIIKNSNVISQYNDMVERENKKFEHFGDEWKNDEEKNRRTIKKIQDELIKQNNIK